MAINKEISKKEGQESLSFEEINSALKTLGFKILKYFINYFIFIDIEIEGF